MALIRLLKELTERLGLKKILLLEFLGKTWGNEGNTTLHLASFMGMSELVAEMLRLGVPSSRVNHKKYRPVDCADDDDTRSLFLCPQSLPSCNNNSNNSSSLNISSNKNHDNEKSALSASQAISAGVSVKKDKSQELLNSLAKITVSEVHSNPLPQTQNNSNSQSKQHSSNGSEAAFHKHKVSPGPADGKRKNGQRRKKVSFDSASLFLDCIISGDLSNVKMLWPSNATTQTSKGMTPLALAAQQGHLALVKFFVSCCQKQHQHNQRISSSSSRLTTISSPQLAASSTQSLSSQTTPTAMHLESVDDEGWTALMHACSEGHFEVCKYLLEAGARSDIINYDGENLLDVTDDPEIQRLLPVPTQ